MHKKIIAIALAGAFITPLAMADVTIYGFMSASVESTGASGGTSPAVTRINVADDSSRIGFKGTEDLGNGLSSIWQVESGLQDFAAGGTSEKGVSATFATRNTFVGLKDQTFGAFYAGNSDSAYKVYSEVGGDIAVNTSAQIGNSGTATIIQRGDARLKNSLHYDSAIWNGLQVGATYGTDEASTTATNQQQYDFGGRYVNGPLTVAAAYNHLSDSAGTSETRTAGVSTQFFGAAAAYSFPTGTKLTANVEHASYGVAPGSSNQTQLDWDVSATQTFGNASVGVSYAGLGNLNNANNPSNYTAHELVLAGYYNLSKQTQLLAYAARTTNGTSQNVASGTNPVMASPTYTTAAEGVGAGNTVHTIGAGIKVNF